MKEWNCTFLMRQLKRVVIFWRILGRGSVAFDGNRSSKIILEYTAYPWHLERAYEYVIETENTWSGTEARRPFSLVQSRIQAVQNILYVCRERRRQIKGDQVSVSQQKNTQSLLSMIRPILITNEWALVHVRLISPSVHWTGGYTQYSLRFS